MQVNLICCKCNRKLFFFFFARAIKEPLDKRFQMDVSQLNQGGFQNQEQNYFRN